MSSVTPSSLSWGFSPKIDDSNEGKHDLKQETFSSSISPEFLASIQSSLQSQQPCAKNKRRYQDDEEYPFPSRRNLKKNDSLKFRIGKKEITTLNTHKRNRAVQRILGQPLPTQRIFEVLDKKNLQVLLNNLINLHPEITDDIYKCAPKPTVINSIEILHSKIESIKSTLPYRVESSSEYSYLRVKPLIEDFLNALSDYTLQFLPPIELNPLNSLDFLDQATSLLHELPNFAKHSNNYFKDMAYEQLSHTWCNCLKEFIKGTNCSTGSSGILILINNNWELKLKKHNELANGKLNSIVEFFKDEMSWWNNEFSQPHQLRHHTPTKLSNLKNFSPNNSPLHPLTNNLLDR